MVLTSISGWVGSTLRVYAYGVFFRGRFSKPTGIFFGSHFTVVDTPSIDPGNRSTGFIDERTGLVKWGKDLEPWGLPTGRLNFFSFIISIPSTQGRIINLCLEIRVDPGFVHCSGAVGRWLSQQG